MRPDQVKYDECINKCLKHFNLNIPNPCDECLVKSTCNQLLKNKCNERHLYEQHCIDCLPVIDYRDWQKIMKEE